MTADPPGRRSAARPAGADRLTPHRDGMLARALARTADAAGRWPALVLTVGGLFAVVSVLLFCTRNEYHTRRSDLASPDKDYQKRWQRYLDEFGDEDDMVVVVRGGDPARLRAAVEDVARQVAGRPDLFDRLFYKVDLTALQDRALLYLPADQLQAVRENLDRMGPLLSAPIGPLAWRSLTMVNLLRQARERAGRIDPAATLAPADEQFLTQLLATVTSANAALADPAAYRNPWSSLLPAAPGQGTELLRRPQYFTSADGTLAFLLAHPVKESNSFAPARAAVDELRGILDATKPRHPDLAIGLTGLPVLETDEMVASQRDSTLAGWLALAGTALLYAVVYRGLRYPLLTVSTLLCGTAWAMGWLTVTVGHVNILSATFAVMLIGLGDYGVLWVTHYEQRRRAGDDPAAATRHTATHTGPSIVTAAVGTALAFFATMLADFRAVAELGWISGCGVLFCAAACFTVLPALIRVTDRRGLLTRLAVVGPDGASHPVYAPEARPAAWLPGLLGRPRAVLAGGAALTLVLGAFAGRVGYDHNLLNMQAAGLDSVRWERELIDATAGASWHADSIAATREQALALKARYEQLPGVSRVVEVASLIPADQERKLDLVGDVRRRLSHLPARETAIVPLTPAVSDLRNEAAFLAGALAPQASISRQPVFGRLAQALAALRDHPTLSAADGRSRLQAFEGRLAADLLADLYRLRDVATPAPITLADLPPALRERYVGASGSWLVQAYAKDDLWDIAPLERFCAAARTVDAEATGKPFGTLEGLRSMQQGFTRAGIYALAVIVAVLALDFRSVRHTALALVPLAVGVVWLLGVMGLFGLDLNPANMIALPLIVGVGVDNGVHVLHDYRARRRGPYALAAATGKGIAVAALTTVLGFGTLMVSGHRGLSGLGFVLALGVTTCMAASLVLLPALLGWKRRLRLSTAAKPQAA
jgi:hopanoid biosynthesis associated RND transporter like protein HpnN